MTDAEKTLRDLIDRWRDEARRLEADADRAKADIGVAGLSHIHSDLSRLARLQNLVADELEAALLQSLPREEEGPLLAEEEADDLKDAKDFSARYKAGDVTLTPYIYPVGSGSLPEAAPGPIPPRDEPVKLTRVGGCVPGRMHSWSDNGDLCDCGQRCKSPAEAVTVEQGTCETCDHSGRCDMQDVAKTYLRRRQLTALSFGCKLYERRVTVREGAGA